MNVIKNENSKSTIDLFTEIEKRTNSKGSQRVSENDSLIVSEDSRSDTDSFEDSTSEESEIDFEREIRDIQNLNRQNDNDSGTGLPTNEVSNMTLIGQQNINNVETNSLNNQIIN